MIHVVIDLYNKGEWFNTFGKEMLAVPQKSDWILYNGIKYQVNDVLYNLDDDTIRVRCNRY